MHSHIGAWGNTAGVLGGDQDILNSIRFARSVNQHLHTDSAVHRVHEHIKLIQAINIVYDTKRVNKRSLRCLTRKRVPRIQNKQETYQRIELAIESQRANSKQMVENDFSPPDNDLGSLSRATPALAVR